MLGLRNLKQSIQAREFVAFRRVVKNGCLNESGKDRGRNFSDKGCQTRHKWVLFYQQLHRDDQKYEFMCLDTNDFRKSRKSY